MKGTAYASGEFVAQHLELNSDVVDTTIPDDRIQPNGVDVGIKKVERISGDAEFVDGDYDKPNRTKMQTREADDRIPVAYYSLVPGNYAITYDVKFEIPDGYIGRMYPRSRLMRSGLHLTSALWDMGYEGIGEGLLKIPRSLDRVRIGCTATIAQFTLIEAATAEVDYDGTHQGERLEQNQNQEQSVEVSVQ